MFLSTDYNIRDSASSRILSVFQPHLFYLIILNRAYILPNILV